MHTYIINTDSSSGSSKLYPKCTASVSAFYKGYPVTITYNFNSDPVDCLDQIELSIDRLIEDGYIGSFDSPIEEMFYFEWHRQSEIALTYQHEVLGGKYRLDFAHLPSKTAIELDGYEWHSSREQFTKDRKRQRELERLGWIFIRFSGEEINNDVSNCVAEALSMLPMISIAEA